MKRRLFTEKGSSWTDEANRIGGDVTTFVRKLIATHPDVDLRDLSSVLHQSVDSPILGAIMTERLSDG